METTLPMIQSFQVFRAPFIGKKPMAGKAAWFLKEKMVPTVYYHLVLKGREWLARPNMPR
mgnify:CR=1 FL=1